MENMNHRDELNKELDELAPGLSRLIAKQTSEDLPFRYFENLPDRVLNKIHAEPEPQINWWGQLLLFCVSRKKLVLAMASITGLIAFAVLMLNNPTPKEWDLSKLEPEEVRTYLLSQASELQDDELSMLHTNENKLDLLKMTDEEFNSIMDEYLDQINPEELN